MTRQEEIRNAIDKIIPISPSRNGRTYEQSLMATGFESGVNWADSNPKSPWISVEDDLPCNNSDVIHFGFTNRVLVIDEHKNIFIAYMKKNGNNEWIWYSDEDNFGLLHVVTHWMPIPKLKED